jgi:hypothetical protein
MNEIDKLTHALELAQDCFEHQEDILALCDFIDEKHQQMIKHGFVNYDKNLIMHGIMGALSHYEAQQYKQDREKRLATLRDAA